MKDQRGIQSSEGTKSQLRLNNPNRESGGKDDLSFTARLSLSQILFSTIAAIFAAEVISMLVSYAVQPANGLVDILIEAGMMAVLICPVLYFLFYRPLASLIEKRRQAEEALRKSYDEMELRVKQRTDDLRLANLELQDENAERKRAEKRLRRSEKRYRSLFNSMTEGFALHEILCDEDGAACDYRFLEVNPSFERLTGLTRESILDRTVKEVLPEIEPVWIETFGRVALTGQPAHLDDYTVSLDRYYSVYAYSPAKKRFAVIFTDVTERKRAEIALQEAADRFRIVADFTYDWELWRSPQNHFLYVSPSCERITGYSRDAFYDDPDLVLQIIHPDDRELVAAHHHDELSTDQACEIEFRIIRPDGQERWIGHACQPVRDEQGKALGRRASNRDITERKSAEAALRQRNQDLEAARAATENEKRRLEAVMEALPVGVAITDRQGGSLRVNRAYEEIWGEPRPEVHSVRDYDAYQAWWADTGQAILPEEWASAQVVQKGVSVIGQLLEIRRFDGSHAFVFNSASPVYDSSGRVVECAVAIQDVTDLRKAEQALRAARDELEARVQERTRELADANLVLVNEINERKEVERQLRIQTTALESAANGIIITGRNGKIRWANPAFLKMTGYPMEEVLGQNPRFLKSGRHDDGFYRELWQTILAGKVWRGEIINRRRDGSLYVEEQTITPLLDENGQLSNFIAIKQDVTERKRTEEALEKERTKLKRILDAMPDGIYIVNGRYEIEYVNPQIEKEFGHVESRKCYTYFHDRSEICPWCKNDEVFQGNSVHWEWHSTKTDRTYELFDTPLVNSDGSISKLELFHDITPRIQAEAELERQNLELQALSETESERRQMAETLRTAAQELTRRLDLDYVLRTLLTHIRPLVHADATSVILMEGEALLSLRAVEGYETWTTPRRILSANARGRNNPIYQKLLSHRKSLLIPDTRREPYWQADPESEQMRSCLFVPILAEEKIIGILSLGKVEAGFFTGEHVRWAEVLAGQAAVAIQNAWLFEQVQASTERLQSLSHRLVEIQENERQYIARELHDEAGQALTSLMVDLRLLEKRAARPDEVLNTVTEMEATLNGVLENLHRLAMALRPASLDHLGLAAAIRQHVEALGNKFGLQVNLQIAELKERISPNIETALYRIVQEALTNVVRHAHASRVDVVLTKRKEKLVLIVEDDGVGFDVGTVSSAGHLGMYSMRERAEMIEGRLIVESSPGRGTTIMVEVEYADPIADRG